MKNEHMIAMALGGIALWMLAMAQRARAETAKPTPMAATGSNPSLLASLLTPKPASYITPAPRSQAEIAFANSLADTAYI